MQPIRVSCVSYVNSLPFVYGLKHHDVNENIILSLDNPAESAFKLREGLADIGLIPVAAISTVPDAIPITKWCIGAIGPVKSVTLLSNVPLEKIEYILLDSESVTSNLLTRVLAENYWKINPVFLKEKDDFENVTSENSAAVLIGDRSLDSQDQFRFIYDLSGEWMKFTSLPFVFARWVTNRILDPGFLLQFENALSQGIENIDAMIQEMKLENSYKPGSESYLKNNLSYTFDSEKKRGMELFLDYTKKVNRQSIREPQ